MGTTFYRGQQLGRNDLNIFLVNAANTPVNAAEISYALYDFTVGQEVLVGVPMRAPVNPSVGEYYASLVVPLDANLGDYRIRWTFREIIGGSVQQVVQEFTVIDKAGLSTNSASMITGSAIGATTTELDLMGRLRILLRDSNPDRNYSFRPPTHEETVQQFSRVFGYIWEDVELQEYLLRSLDMISASPPRTPFTNIDQMVSYMPEWRTLLLTGAMIHALQALRINWIADEFSLAPETLVTVILPYQDEVDLYIEDLYLLLHNEEDHPLIAPLIDDNTKFSIQNAFHKGKLCVRSVNTQKEVVVAKLGDVLRHFTAHKPLYRVSTENGYVEVTGDHSLYRYDGILPVAVRDLVIGDSIVQVINEDILSVVVTDIKILDPVNFTYDLSVPETENFLLSNGLLAHNSYSIGGISLDLEKSSKYEGAYQSASDQFDKQLEKAKLTINIVKGLQQPRFGLGIRSSFGPFLGRGLISPRKYIGASF